MSYISVCGQACVCQFESERVKTIREHCKPASVLNNSPFCFCDACRHFLISADSVLGVLSVLVLPALQSAASQPFG